MDWQPIDTAPWQTVVWVKKESKMTDQTTIAELTKALADAQMEIERLTAERDEARAEHAFAAKALPGALTNRIAELEGELRRIRDVANGALNKATGGQQ